jgi:signal transduction histidine kinase
MSEKLCIIGCHNFHREVAAAIAAEGWDDVFAAEFPSRCGHPPVTWEELRALIPECCDQLVVMGRACLSVLGEPPRDFPPTQIVHLEQCFHLVAGQQLVNEAISSGAYLITPAWLADWRGQLQMMGFAPDQGGEFFHDFARELVLLDTGIDPDSGTRLAELSSAVKLPTRRIAVGLDITRLLLARIVLEWRVALELRHAKEKERRQVGEMADMVAAMDMLTRLAKTQNEADAIAEIDELFHMLFAPEALHYLRVENDIPIPVAPIPDAMQSTMRELCDDYALIPDGRGFLLRIGRSDHVLGVIAIDGLAFPAYRDRYLNMALAVTGVCGLAIENARNRRRLLEAEKMASLAILVAGVAHEINTPLGIGLTAASTLQRHSKQLSQRFGERSMTQSDLQQYLQTAGSSTGLILDNLERIGHLIDAFRQVAVNGKSGTEEQIFKLNECVSEVIRSLGDRLSPERIAINIQCDPELEIESLRGDWASIFINLIGNSLKHGFRGRERGIIDIRIAKDAKELRVDYRDDGVGLAPEALARIFDPFYTTDLQHGMGLGMHLVYNLITHRMHGSIQCESQPGQGVKFHIEIPQ